MKEKLYRFMMGRYGNDQLNRFLMILVLVFFVCSVFGSGFFYLLGLACLIYVYFRMMSKNTYKRSLENNRYLQYEFKVKQFLGTWKRDMQQRKTHHIYRCPSCRQKIRIPRGKGRIEIRCPKCSQTFIKKS
ncbi:MAG: hypothetical protein HDR71_14910 [Lachnospiraceae bacterium]|nr:hypothetical protein [Lachnospiraceae bacterium]